MQLYGLYSQKQDRLMSFSFSSNSGDFCNDTKCNLSGYSSVDNLWITNKKEIAENICVKGSTEWYNSSFETPTWSEDYFGELSVVNLNEVEFD